MLHLRIFAEITYVSRNAVVLTCICFYQKDFDPNDLGATQFNAYTPSSGFILYINDVKTHHIWFSL